MNVKLKKTFDFATGMVYQKKFLINLYSIELKMVTATNNPTDQNIAYERIHYWIDSVLNDGVLIADDSELISAYRETGQRLITLPTDPVDQVIGFILFSKFNLIERCLSVAIVATLSTESKSDFLLTITI